MAGSWLDALLGAVFNSGSEIPISGGLNFTGGLKAVLNRATGRIDAALVNPPQAPGVQTEWVPVDGDSDSVVAIAAGHDAGFYLVGSQVTFSAEPADGQFTPTYAWGEGSGSGSIDGSDADAAALVAGTPALVYSDGSVAITVTWSSTTTDETVTGTVRAVALRVSG